MNKQARQALLFLVIVIESLLGTCKAPKFSWDFFGFHFGPGDFLGFRSKPKVFLFFGGGGGGGSGGNLCPHLHLPVT